MQITESVCYSIFLTGEEKNKNEKQLDIKLIFVKIKLLVIYCTVTAIPYCTYLGNE